MPNRLAGATSPYLLQHADNPVDWHEWGAEAFALAAREDRPVLLSVGYSACHWCHVMAHESFEDAETAAFMNQRFVNVKVDREERPDIDSIYMSAVQAMTGRGGWPMTVFLTPDARPFYAGTYFPPDDRPGFPSFRRVMAAVLDAWDERRDEIEGQAEKLTTALADQIPVAADVPGPDAIARAYDGLRLTYDAVHGGFGGAPKFPQAPTLEFLLRVAGDEAAPEAAAMLHHTLEAMARGGIYDHLGGGFARYSVDARWAVPHFEKMLYDNALLARTYLRGWQVTGDDRFRTVAVETIEYLLRDLLLPEGGFASAEDADSEGEEGKFYVFDHDEFHECAGPDDGPLAAAYFGVTTGGNFEGATVLAEAARPEELATRFGVSPADVTAAVARVKDRLLQRRSERVRPGLDDKVVTAWNGLAARALAEAGAVLGEDRYLDAARANARFVLAHLRTPEGRLLRSWRQGAAVIPAFAEDYAAYALALFTLYQATGDVEWYREAAALVDDLVALFADGTGGGFFATGTDAEELISRPKELMDNPAPSGNSMAAEALLQLAAYTGRSDAHELIDGVLRQAGALVDRFPGSVGHLLAVLVSRHAPPKEVAVVGPDTDPATRALRNAVWERFRPACFLAVDPGDGSAAAHVPLLAGRAPHSGPPLAYVCRDFSCDAPTGDPVVLIGQLDA